MSTVKWQNIAPRISLIPGLCHIYGSVFVAATSDFRCSDDLIDVPIDEVVYNKSLSVDTCSKPCEGDYIFDKSFWTSTLRIQWSLVCERNHLATIGKMTLFAGFGAGTFGAGLISDVRILYLCLVLLQVKNVLCQSKFFEPAQKFDCI